MLAGKKNDHHSLRVRLEIVQSDVISLENSTENTSIDKFKQEKACFSFFQSS